MNPTVAPPIVFTDATGREWLPVFDDHVVWWLRYNADLDLEELIRRNDFNEITSTFSTNTRMVLALFVASFARAGFAATEAGFYEGRAAMERGIPAEGLATICRGFTALLHALRRRWPDSEALTQIARTMPRARRDLLADGEII